MNRSAQMAGPQITAWLPGGEPYLWLGRSPMNAVTVGIGLTVARWDTSWDSESHALLSKISYILIDSKEYLYAKKNYYFRGPIYFDLMLSC